MSNTQWPIQVRKLEDGKPVSAPYGNISLDDLARRTDFLKNSFDLLGTTNGKISIPNAHLASGLAIGDILYWDTAQNRFDKAIAECSQDPSTGIFYASEKSFAIGILVTLTGPVTGTILTFGSFNFEENGISLVGMMDEEVSTPYPPSGRYYLSHKVAGRMTTQPAAPLVQIGFFTPQTCFVSLLQKDLFESHYHFNMQLAAKPSASQNFSRTGRNSSTSTWYVDYFNNNVSTPSTPHAGLLLCVKKLPTSPLAPGTLARVDIFKDGSNKMGVTLTYGAGLSYENPQSTGATTTTVSLNWPTYGAWVTAPGTDLQFAFVRVDRDYLNHSTLAVDVMAGLTTNTDRYKVFIPNDYSGWTNANTFDVGTPSTAWFTYIHSGDASLNPVFPPVPASSTVIEQNGVALQKDIDYSVNPVGLFWISKNVSDPLFYGPWPFDYNSINPPVGSPAMDYSLNGKHLKIYFSRTIFTNNVSIVKSLRSRTPSLRITKCPGGGDGDTGDLEVTFDLALSINENEDASTNPFVFTDVSGTSLVKGKAVRKIVAGNNISVTSDFPGDDGVGAVTVSADSLLNQGELGSISLINAKETITNNISFVQLLIPSKQSAFVGKISIPYSSVSGEIAINLRANILGSLPVVPGVTQRAIVRVMYILTRPGIGINSMTEGVNVSDGNELMVRYWNIEFTGYTQNTVLNSIHPIDPANNPDLYKLSLINANPNSLIAGMSAPDNWIKPGDSLSVKFKRVAADPTTGTIDDYEGNLGFTNIRWIIE